MSQSDPRWWPRLQILSYGMAVLSALVVLGILQWMRIGVGQQSTPVVALFLCAVMFSAWFGGVGPCLLTVAICLLAFDYYFATPLYSFAVDIKEIPRLLIFLLSAFFVGSLSAAQRSATEKLRSARDELSKTVQALGQTNDALQLENAERRRVDEALRESEERFRQMAENSREVFWMTTADLSNILYISPAYEAIWGRSCESLYREPRSFFSSIHSEDRPAVLGIREGEFEERFEVEYRVVRPDGSIRWVWDHGFPIKDESGLFYRLAGIAEDITERKQAEEKLKQSESLLAEAQRLAHVGSWDYDPRSHTVTWSDELYRIAGVQPGEIDPTHSATSFVHPVDRDTVLNTFYDCVKNRKPYSMYYRVLRRNGDERIVHSEGRTVSDELGEPIRVFGATQDLTELKRAEEKLKATTEQLRALSARLQSAREEEATRIARGIHDELGAALSSLRWDLEDVDETVSELQNGSQLEKVRQKIVAMISLTDATVNTVRRIASELRPIVLDALGLTEAIEWQALQFQERTGIMIQCDCTLENIDLSLEQSTATFRIFQEALTNILRHAQATRVIVQMKAENSEFLLTISDNGRGITGEEKLGQHTLGLLGMRERAHLIGAKIDIAGFTGKGTLVTVRVPLSG